MDHTAPTNTAVRRALARIAARTILTAARLITGVRGIWLNSAPQAEQTWTVVARGIW